MRAAIAELHAAHSPWLIGVRHHSAVLARVVFQLLDRIQPETVLIELPADLQPWLEHVADEQTVAPIAISAVPRRGGMFFYPLADFSPELVAIRWARQNAVPVVACDLPIALGDGPVDMTAWDEPMHGEADRGEAKRDKTPSGDAPAQVQPQNPAGEGLLERWLSHSGASDTGDLWQRLVESPGVDADAETIRRGALTFGWAVRTATPEIDRRDRLREAAMRQAIRRAEGKSVAVIGAFHAPALLPEVLESLAEQDERVLRAAEAAAEGADGQKKPGGSAAEQRSVGVSLIPYSFAQLDERSGYPAGILDPVWHQRMLQAPDHTAMDRAATELVTDICRQLRRQGHVAGTPDATETVRMMRDLARLRGLANPGRGELIESLQSCLVQGDPLGRGRAVAAAAEPVLIGNRQGRVTPHAPRCGLAIAIEQELAALKLPGPDPSAASRPSRPRSAYRSQTDALPAEHEKELSLDVLRKPRERARAVMLRRLCAAGIPYARRVDTVQTGWRENLLERWIVGWQQGTSATIDSLSRLGVTLPQVVAALVRDIGRSPGEEAETPLPETVLRRLEIAAECGLADLTLATLRRIDSTFRDTANISQLVNAATILTRVQLGWMPGLPKDAAAAYPPVVEPFRLPEGMVEGATLLRIALDRLEGLSGSNDPTDVQAVAELIGWFTGELAMAAGEVHESTPPGRERLLRWCQLTLRGGSERMRGAAAGALAQLDQLPAAELSALLQGWVDGATDRTGRSRLQHALAGLAQVLLSRMQSEPAWLDGLSEVLASLDDPLFLSRLPALRGGFADISPADRERLLELRLAELTERGSAMDALVASGIDHADPEQAAATIVRCRTADLAGRAAVVRLFPELEQLLSGSEPAPPSLSAGTDSSPPVDNRKRLAEGQITLADRWRMIFGVPPQSNSPTAQRASTSLDQLYGHGRGEGSRGGLARRPKGSTGGGTEAPQPTAAQWADDLESLFGSDVCQEVLGEAATAGRVAAVELLDVESVQPSVELLQQVLALAGSVPEAKLQKLRQLARRITEQLAQKLAVRLQAALSGLSTPRPTRRRNRRLNLPRTIRANLVHCHRRSDGRPTIIAEQLIFNAPAKRQMDWHLTFVVDVSGSMSASVVYSALVAAIFDALPALSVRFLTFSTEVIDLSAQVEDPLSLLLDVQIGGGTDIGLGLRAARAGIKVPSRSIVVLVSDFEEGVSVGQMLAEVRALVDAGVKCLGLAALDDTGVARFHQGYAQMMASVGMAVAAVSPEKLASWVGDQIRGSSTTGMAPR